jgi:hypothetical protein
MQPGVLSLIDNTLPPLTLYLAHMMGRTDFCMPNFSCSAFGICEGCPRSVQTKRRSCSAFSSLARAKCAGFGLAVEANPKAVFLLGVD